MTQSKNDKGEWKISVPQTRIHTLEQLVKHFEIDLSIWEVEHFVANKWEGMSSAKGVVPLYQVKAFLKKRKNIVAAKTEIAALEALAKGSAPKPFPVSKPPNPVKSPHKRSQMLEVNITDHHFGKLAWSPETLHANYDSKIAARVFETAFKTILARSGALDKIYEEIWFVVGNDLLNSDSASGKTTSGTQVSSDARYQKTFVAARTCLIKAIESLRTLTPKVKVIVVPGNHDALTTWSMGSSLECYFHNYTDVEIDNEPSLYKYHQYGKVMLMFAHGDKGKREDYPLLMATEQPKMFGNTKFREAHTGHLHQVNTLEKHGVRIRILSALCAPDAWHAENTYVNNLRSSEAFVWDKEEGLIGTVIYTEPDNKGRK